MPPANLHQESTPLVAAAPGLATVGESSVQAIAANPGRLALAIRNTGTTTISLAFGSHAAVAGSGVVLGPGMSSDFSKLGVCRQAVNAISSAAGGTLAYQDWS